MSRRRRGPRIPAEPVSIEIDSLSHDGRGVGRIEGKAAFVAGALPGEQVQARFLDRRRRFDALRTLEVEANPASDRVTPPCPHADLCGGCSLQHLAPAAQVRLKADTLAEQFAHFGGIEPEQWAEPLTGETLGYRRKARLGVRYVTKREEVLVGFREKGSSFITAINDCAVLDPRVGQRIEALKSLIAGLSVYNRLAQIEVACGDEDAALVLRHLEPLTADDEATLVEFARAHDLQIYLQPKGPDTVHRLWPQPGNGPDRLFYQLPEWDLTLGFHPMDFTQVNADINQRMIAQALEWLAPEPHHRVLDLFCGLGNFSLPLARQAAEVVGVEGEEALVQRGRENAERNGIANATFRATDLQQDFTAEPWAAEGFDRVLIDPPRSGAEDVVRHLAGAGVERIVYVSCNPATLARDAGILVASGYRLVRAGIMDMFPHTAHVESMALFVRESR